MTDQTGNEQLTVSMWGGFLTQTYSVISKITTHTGSTVTFNDLVLNDANNPNDKFILYATAEGKTDPIMLPQEFRNTDQSVTNCTFGGHGQPSGNCTIAIAV